MEAIKTKIYIAGKVTGEPLEECRKKFADVQEILEAKGYQVVNPMNLVSDQNVSWQEAMDICVPELLKCNGILMLPCSKYSKGAHIELELAMVSGLNLYSETGEL